jgi:hypothetical protein
MTAELYLIAHKVRGEPAFDIAERMTCAVCGQDEIAEDNAHPERWGCTPGPGCQECNGLGYWWIIPTSGWRAYPWWNARLIDIDDTYELDFVNSILKSPGPMPPDLRDHYQVTAEPKRTIDVSALLQNAPKLFRR